ncbi:MAG: hypothetical protein KDN22_22630 [Verrucomicrobiae bacterium]|nr:hypothetical protein [Verrucomicrobiae bacterium]
MPRALPVPKGKIRGSRGDGDGYKGEGSRLMMGFLSRSPARAVAGTLLVTVLVGALPLMVLVHIEASHKERFTQKIDRIVSDLRGMDLTLFHQGAIDSQLIDASEGKIGRAAISEGLADALSRRGLEISRIRVEGSGDFPHVVFDIGNVAEESSVPICNAKIGYDRRIGSEGGRVFSWRR